MAGSMTREALKKGMKTWIVASDRVRTMVAKLREDLEDVVIAARQEYESQADTHDRPDTESASRPAAKPKARRAHAKREESAKATGDTKKAKASA